MTNDELKWLGLQIQLQVWRKQLTEELISLGGMVAKDDKDFQRFMARVLKPITKGDMDL